MGVEDLLFFRNIHRMELKVNVKNLSQVSSPEEKIIVNTVIDKLSFDKLLKILKNQYSETTLVDILAKMYRKKIIFATPADRLLQNPTQETRDMTVTPCTQVADPKEDKLKKEIDQIYEKIEKRSIYYDIFSILPTTNSKEIKLRYFELSRKFHPDRIHKFNFDDHYQFRADRISIQLTNIYNILKNAAKKKEYNQSIGLKKKTRSSGSKSGQSNAVEKIQEFSELAIEEYRQQNYEKSLKLIKMAISYGSQDTTHLQLRKELEVKVKEYEKIQFKRKIDHLMIQRDYERALLLVESQIEKHKSAQLYVQKANIMQNISSSQHAEYIIEAYQDALELEGRSVSIREKFIQFLAFIERKEILIKEIEALLSIDPKNKIAKKHTKRSLWSMFSVSI